MIIKFTHNDHEPVHAALTLRMNMLRIVIIQSALKIVSDYLHMNSLNEKISIVGDSIVHMAHDITCCTKIFGYVCFWGFEFSSCILVCLSNMLLQLMHKSTTWFHENFCGLYIFEHHTFTN